MRINNNKLNLMDIKASKSQKVNQFYLVVNIWLCLLSKKTIIVKTFKITSLPNLAVSEISSRFGKNLKKNRSKSKFKISKPKFLKKLISKIFLRKYLLTNLSMLLQLFLDHLGAVFLNWTKSLHLYLKIYAQYTTKCIESL